MGGGRAGVRGSRQAGRQVRGRGVGVTGPSAPRRSGRDSGQHVRGRFGRGRGWWRIVSREGGGRGRGRGELPTYGGCTVERETGETRKVRGDPRGKARGKRPYLVHVGIAAGGRVTGIYLGRGVRARDSMQDRAGLTLPLPSRRPTMTLRPSMDKAVEMEGVGGGHGCPAVAPGLGDGGGSLGGRG